MELIDALKFARSGQALLFLGAGFSLETPNIGSSTMKSGQGLSDLLATSVGLPAGTGLMDTSEAFLEQNGAEALVAVLKQEFGAASLLPHQAAVPAIPWRQIYSTNYDDVVEKSYLQAGIPLHTVNPDMVIASIPKGVTPCIHLNGSVIDITSAKLASQIKLTDSSYLTSSLAESEWAVRLRQDIDAAQAVFYVGYSTYDLDIARLLFAKSALKNKSFFALGTGDYPVLKRRIEKFGVDLRLSAADFFEEILKDEYSVDVPAAPVEICIKTYEIERPAQAFRDDDIFNLFRLGEVCAPFVFESITAELRYCLARRQVDQIMKIIDAAPSGVIVHSLLGNGKTLILESLKVRATVEGFTVFELVRQKESLYSELDAALQRKGRLLCIIDNYGNWLDAIKYIGNHQVNNLSVVMASRSGPNDVLAPRANELLKLDDLFEIAADRLSETEILDVVEAMNAYGLWGEKASWPLLKKQNHLSIVCKGEWQAILVELFKAPQIKNRLDKLIAGIRGEEAYNVILITILVLSIIDIPASTDMLTDLCGERTLTVGFRQSEIVGELIDFENDEVRLRSSVTGAFLLRNVSDPETVLRALIAITKAADRAAFASREYMTLLATLMRFGNVQSFFSEAERSELVLRYYEAVKELNHCKRYPLFWLQFAMACLFVDDFHRAQTYFDSAYSFAKLTNFRTYQIDNHYARFLLRRSISNDDPAIAMKDFRDARALIFEQIRRERLHYPYRVASLISDWFDSYGDRLNDEHRTEVKRAAVFICSRIAALPEIRQRQRDIADCYRKLQIIVQEH
jgi:hypothetical protein